LNVDTLFTKDIVNLKKMEEKMKSPSSTDYTEFMFGFK